MDALKPNSFIFVVGLPGSGKTYFCKKVSKKLRIPFFDDPKTIKELYSFINKNPCGILCSPLFCIPKYRKKIRRAFKGMKIKIKWIFFEKNVKQCIINDSHRKMKASSDIIYFNSIYKIPSHYKTIKVFKIA